jgi:hypothetical protein
MVMQHEQLKLIFLAVRSWLHVQKSPAAGDYSNVPLPPYRETRQYFFFNTAMLATS